MTSVVAVYLLIQGISIRGHVLQVGSGGDAIRWDVRGKEVNRVLATVDKLLPKTGTMAVVPEGAMLNYLARRKNPTGYVSVMPLEFLLFGEERIAQAFKDNPPDMIVVVNRDLLVYDSKGFGEDYAERLAAWMRQNYRVHEILHSSIDNQLAYVILTRAKPGSDSQSAPATDATSHDARPQ